MKKLLKFSSKKFSAKNNCVSNPVSAGNSDSLNFLTLKVLKLYEKNSDIKKFSKLVLEDNIDDNFIAQTEKELQQKGVFNPFYYDENIKALAENERLMNDLTPNSD